MDNGALYMGVNGTYWNSGDPTSGSSKTGKIADLNTSQIHMFVIRSYGSSGTNESEAAVNFGSPPFSISSGNSDATVSYTHLTLPTICSV